MQRVASVKSVLQEKRDVDDDDSRSPECVERVWTDEQDGAWAEGKAPVHLLTALLSHVQDGDVAQAELTARASTFPNWDVALCRLYLVQDLLSAMQQRELMGTVHSSHQVPLLNMSNVAFNQTELESESEEESDSEDGDDQEEGDDEAASPQDCEEKSNEEK